MQNQKFPFHFLSAPISPPKIQRNKGKFLVLHCDRIKRTRHESSHAIGACNLVSSYLARKAYEIICFGKKPLSSFLVPEEGISLDFFLARRSEKSGHSLVCFACWQNMTPAFDPLTRAKQLARSQSHSLNARVPEEGISLDFFLARRSEKSGHSLVCFACWQNMTPAFDPLTRAKQLARSQSHSLNARVPEEGIEPPTPASSGLRSATELLRQNTHALRYLF